MVGVGRETTTSEPPIGVPEPSTTAVGKGVRLGAIEPATTRPTLRSARIRASATDPVSSPPSFSTTTGATSSAPTFEVVAGGRLSSLLDSLGAILGSGGTGVSVDGAAASVAIGGRVPGTTGGDATIGWSLLGASSLASFKARPLRGLSQGQTEWSGERPNEDRDSRLPLDRFARARDADLTEPFAGRWIFRSKRESDDRDRSAIQRQAEVSHHRQNQALPQSLARTPARPGHQSKQENDETQRPPGPEIGAKEMQETFQVQTGDGVVHQSSTRFRGFGVPRGLLFLMKNDSLNQSNRRFVALL